MKYLSIIIVSIMLFSSCKKETSTNVQEKEISNNVILSDPNWQLTQESVETNLGVVNIYINNHTGQKLYSCIISERTNFDQSLHTDEYGHISCKGNGSKCANRTLDDEKVILIRL